MALLIPNDSKRVNFLPFFLYVTLVDKMIFFYAMFGRPHSYHKKVLPTCMHKVKFNFLLWCLLWITLSFCFTRQVVNQ